MDPACESMIEQLRAGGSRQLQQLIHDADLDRPAVVDPAAAEVVHSFQWLSTRVGEGIALTKAGYLPPAVVTETMHALGWNERWIGRQNREDLTLPVLELRESMQRFGLLRKNRGILVPTKIGRTFAGDPVGLWWYVAGRLPDARTESERDAGNLYLLCVAARRPDDHALLSHGMTVLGWGDRSTGAPLTGTDALRTAWNTTSAFRSLGLAPGRWGRDRDDDHAASASAIALARAALVGRPTGTAARPARHGGAADVVDLTAVLNDIRRTGR